MDYIHACERGAWTLETWPITDPENISARPFTCRSWRHEGACRQFKGAQDFERIKWAIEHNDYWLHIVLTYPTWKSVDLKWLYRQGLHDWAKLRKRLHRRFKKMRYVQVWERTRKGYPHCHMAVTCERLYYTCGTDAILNWWEVLRPDAIACGFGKIGWCKPITRGAAMAKYLANLAAEVTGTGKAYQIPVNAPRHFRRLRASVGLLPPIYRNPDLSGRLAFCDLGGEIFD